MNCMCCRFLLAVPFLAISAAAWAPVTSFGRSALNSAQGVRSLPAGTGRSGMSSLCMAVDYNDPKVGEEFAKVQMLSFDEVEEELMKSGVTVPPAMNEVDVQLMLVEMRLMGQIGPKDKGKRPEKFSSKFEEALWTKPAFEKFFNEVKEIDVNHLNVVSEYVNDPEGAMLRYKDGYELIMMRTEQVLNAPLPVDSPTIKFSGFPSTMGEAGCKMTLEAVGPVTDFECTESDDAPILVGTVTFEDLEDAKKAVAQYNGMDMGMGMSVELLSV